MRRRDIYTYLSFDSFFSFSSIVAHPNRINNLRLRNLHRQTRHPPSIPPSILPPRNPRRHLLDLPYPHLAQPHLLRRLRLSHHLHLQPDREILETVDQGGQVFGY